RAKRAGAEPRFISGRTHPETPNLSSFPLSSTITETHTLSCLVAQFPSRPLPVTGKLESRDFFLISRSRWFAEKMIDASPFSSLEDAISFARQLWFKESRIQSWLDAFSGHSHLFRAIRYAPGSMMREMLHWDRKYRAKFGFEFITSTETWLSQEILDEVKVRYENTLVVELDIAAREEFKLIEHGLERLWE
ncbi:hypothetical protein S245_037068, partial [Arachis hypogaea]